MRAPRSQKELPGQYFKKSSRSFYSILQPGKEQYWRRVKLSAIDSLRRAAAPRIIERISDDCAYGDLAEAGVPEEIIDDHPELITMAKRGRFDISREWVEQNFQERPLAHLVKNQERSGGGLPPLEPLESEDRTPPSRKRLADALKIRRRRGILWPRSFGGLHACGLRRRQRTPTTLPQLQVSFRARCGLGRTIDTNSYRLPAEL